MRRSRAITLGATAVLASAGAVIALWLPAWQADQNRKWQTAGAQALERVNLPAAFHAHDDSGSSYQLCVDSAVSRCFVTATEPRQSIGAVQAALAAVTTGPVQADCTLDPPFPPPCHLQVPVAGGRLLVLLFSRPVERVGGLAHWKLSGSYVQVLVDGDRAG